MMILKNINCKNHKDIKELERMYFAGELTDIPPLNNNEFIAYDYGYELCELCDKWMEQE